MGQRSSPLGLRLGINRKWNISWISSNNNENRNIFFFQKNIENFFKSFLYVYVFTRKSITKRVVVIDVKLYNNIFNKLFFFVFFYKMRTKRRMPFIKKRKFKKKWRYRRQWWKTYRKLTRWLGKRKSKKKKNIFFFKVRKKIKKLKKQKLKINILKKKISKKKTDRKKKNTIFFKKDNFHIKKKVKKYSRLTSQNKFIIRKKFENFFKKHIKREFKRKNNYFHFYKYWMFHKDRQYLYRKKIYSFYTWNLKLRKKFKQRRYRMKQKKINMRLNIKWSFWKAKLLRKQKRLAQKNAGIFKRKIIYIRNKKKPFFGFKNFLRKLKRIKGGRKKGWLKKKSKRGFYLNKNLFLVNKIGKRYARFLSIKKRQKRLAYNHKLLKKNFLKKKIYLKKKFYLKKKLFIKKDYLKRKILKKKYIYKKLFFKKLMLEKKKHSFFFTKYLLYRRDLYTLIKILRIMPDIDDLLIYLRYLNLNFKERNNNISLIKDKFLVRNFWSENKKILYTNSLVKNKKESLYEDDVFFFSFISKKVSFLTINNFKYLNNLLLNNYFSKSYLFKYWISYFLKKGFVYRNFITFLLSKYKKTSFIFLKNLLEKQNNFFFKKKIKKKGGWKFATNFNKYL